MSTSFCFNLNGRRVTVHDTSTHTTLLEWLRATGLTGTKEGCAEGDCGACTLAMIDTDAHGARVWRGLNACITLLPMVADREIVTVEGIAEGGPHPVQQAMVNHYGSQCGYCTPGFVMSMFEAWHRVDLRCDQRAAVADQLCGNLCRCTGYRPIREAALDALARREACQRDGSFARDRHRLPLATPGMQASTLTYEGEGGERFDRPTSLEALCALLHAHPDAVMVAGATEIGVEVNKKFRHVRHLVTTEHVPELRRIESHASHWFFGGAVTLTAMEEAIGAALPGLTKMLQVFASRQIRNRATLAGNLVTASPIGDLAPVMLALDAVLVLRAVDGAREVPAHAFFRAYRNTALRAGEVVEGVRIPKGPASRELTRRFDTYKVSKRRELDISIVAAAFCVDTDGDGIVRHARLAYGGVAATPVRATAAEEVLVGHPWNAAARARCSAALATAFSPIDDVRSGRGFREGLVVSLFEKFFDGVETASQDLPLDFVPTATPEVSDASRALRHESALGHATGTAAYTEDQALGRAMLELWPVMSPHAHARIVRRNADRARAMPGVAAVLFADDIPGTNDIGAVRHDETLLAADEVLFHGHMVAIVAAESYAQARAAALAVEVDYEPLPAVLGLDAAIAEGSYHTEGHRIRRGDANAAIEAAPHALSGTLTLGGQEHFYLEAQAAWAEREDDGSLHVVSSTQHPSEIQAVVSHVLKVPRHRVTVESPRMGGGFGGKETQGNAWAALVALVAHITGRPARVMLDRDLDMVLTGKRHPFRATYRVGFDDEGKLLGAEIRLVNDGGWALDLSESICDRALFHLDNAYYIPAVDFSGRVAKTHTVSNTAFRGFGGPQGMVVIEEVLDRVARRLSLAPEVVRARNLYRGDGETATTHYGQPLGMNRLPRIWSEVMRVSDFATRREEIKRWNATHPLVKRGLAVTPVKFGISFTATFLNQAGAYLVMYRDGSVQVNHGGTEMGQGLYTKLQGLVMRELGLSAERVRMMKTRTDKVPNTSATAASAGADLNGAAVRDACERLRERLASVAATMLGVDASTLRFEDNCVRGASPEVSLPIERVCERAYFEQVQLSATGFYRTPGIGYDKAAGRGKPFYYFAYGAAVVEVEVDGYSGMKRVLRTDIVHDVGDSLNPGVDRGQIEGAFVQGLGWLTGEELKWDAAGRLMTHSASTYQIPAVSDAPMDLRVTLLPDAAQAGVVHGSKAVGEPPLMLAIAAREAIRDAVAAFGEPGGEVPLPSPATHEAIYLTLRARLERCTATVAK